ncbi:MAG: 30S ribosomal protein S20 [Pseudomonadota bacterium]|nr:30S ribosomal protein S20 [Pseudomonadota bacterium]MEC9078394.1 30S ribosomal protein S20 [Pseudomonadota bacterium]
MPNIMSAKKRMRQTARKTEVNRARRSRIRTFIKKIDLAVQSGDKADAQLALKLAQPEIMRGVTRGIMHRNTAARKISRMAARIQALS